MKKIKAAWELMKTCWRVLQLDRELMVFPILSLAACGLVIASIVAPLWYNEHIFAALDWLSDDPENPGNPYALFFGFLVYFMLFFIIIFFNTALIACAKIRFGGGDPTVADGINAALARLPQILAWTAVASVVGFVLKVLTDNSKGFIGKFVIGLLGAGWAIATYFAVPVLVSEKLGPLDTLKRSSAIIRKSWGEALVAEVGFAAIGGAIGFGAVLIGFLGIVLFDFVPVISIIIFVALAITILFVILAMATLDSILKAALYLYATEGKVPAHFEASMMENAFHKDEKDL